MGGPTVREHLVEPAARDAPERPLPSVVVCTRDRPDDLRVVLASLRRLDGELREVIVVDQSTSRRDQADDELVRFVTTDTVGLSRARNLGLEAATGEVVLMTDDDCEVSVGWAAAMSAPFADPQVVAVFGDVLEADHDREAGFIPHCIAPDERVVASLWQYDPRIGIGASFGVRRDRALATGGFDPVLGAGAELKAGEEHDLVMRLLGGGGAVAYCKRAPLVHHGFRTFDEGRTLIRGYLLGTAAAHAKLIRRRRFRVVAPFARAAWASTVPLILSSLRHGRLPPVLGRVSSLIRGTWQGVRRPVDEFDRFRAVGAS